MDAKSFCSKYKGQPAEDILKAWGNWLHTDYNQAEQEYRSSKKLTKLVLSTCNKVVKSKTFVSVFDRIRTKNGQV
jgi:hypothetical protein